MSEGSLDNLTTTRLKKFKMKKIAIIFATTVALFITYTACPISILEPYSDSYLKKTITPMLQPQSSISVKDLPGDWDEICLISAIESVPGYSIKALTINYAVHDTHLLSGGWAIMLFKQGYYVQGLYGWRDEVNFSPANGPQPPENSRGSLCVKKENGEIKLNNEFYTLRSN